MVQNLEYIKVFYYVARCGSLTQAARELSISQPAVSQSLKMLELSVGTPLFARNAKGVKLTRARLEREPVRKIPLGPPGSGKDGGVESAGSGGSAKQVIIQKVIIPADLKTIKDLRQLLEILKELESYSEANEDAEDDGDPDAALQPA